GIAVLGSIGTAVYRAVLAGTDLTGVPPAAAAAARDTLGAAVAAAAELPPAAADAVLQAARTAFVDGMQLTALVSAAIALAAAGMALVALRSVRPAAPSDDTGHHAGPDVPAPLAGLVDLAGGDAAPEPAQA
ncbi:MAG: MFS transporter, partial [Actinobacteria bacterium]|nr:MFS transporter [Actinomycetota bacterium]